ncbi:MAG: hypothetical protein ABSG80_05470 [Verrucomicrobiota bacterium]|jgi:hypothetical protein
MSCLFLVEIWIWVSALASVAGWLLSALGQLNRPGYAVFFAGVVILVLVCRQKPGLVSCKKRSCWEKIHRRFRRPLPLCFAVLALLVFLGGVLYPPTHYNAMTYHIPRVLHWLAAGRWHWIHTPVGRMNYSGCDFEWLSAPLLLFTKSDRALFLLNFIPFLLLPGLIFSVFMRLGVRARVAWQWMWLFPTGYIFLLQAGSAGNDAFSAVYALAATDFGCRAWKSRRPRDLWFSLLAAALLTGTKPISLPLLLPWLILIFALLPLLRHQALSSLLVLAMAMVASFFPIALMNKIHCGDWLGTSIESSHLQVQKPLIGILGNVFQLLLHNFVPPLFPPTNWWNQHGVMILPHSWIVDFQPGFSQVGELPTEDWAGVGFGISLLLAVSVAANFSRAGGALAFPGRAVPAEFRRFVLIAPWIALLFFCATSAMNSPARLIAPYYPLLLPLLLAGAGQSQIVRRGWWRAMTGGVLLLALVVLILSPDRPLWPAKAILSETWARHPDQCSLARALKVYTVYSGRSDTLAGVRALLPPDLKVVGFIGTADDCDISLWRPFGGRRVEHFFLTDPPEQIRQQVQYVVLGGFNLKIHDTTLDAWLQSSGTELVATTNATLKVAEGLQPWYIVKFKP